MATVGVKGLKRCEVERAGHR